MGITCLVVCLSAQYPIVFNRQYVFANKPVDKLIKFLISKIDKSLSLVVCVRSFPDAKLPVDDPMDR